MDYSLNMQEILRVLDISQAEMAMNLGISRQHMNNIIKGRSKFTNKQLYLLNKIYNVNLIFYLEVKVLFCVKHHLNNLCLKMCL